MRLWFPCNLVWYELFWQFLKFPEFGTLMRLSGILIKKDLTPGLMCTDKLLDQALSSLIVARHLEQAVVIEIPFGFRFERIAEASTSRSVVVTVLGRELDL
jgi:hypothetical protein